MPIEASPLLAKWRRAASDLGLDVVGPFEVILLSGTCLQAPVLIRCFGGANGMLLIFSYESVKERSSEILQAGYGFSVVSMPDLDEDYDREIFVEVLSDWGWSGAEAERPAWLTRGEAEGHQP
jgi:hypothetical protein